MLFIYFLENFCMMFFSNFKYFKTLLAYNMESFKYRNDIVNISNLDI